jgi:adenosylcobinamide-phosphate synthase
MTILWRDRSKHESPNSAWPEAAMAGALGIQLGGLNHYFGEPSLKPLLGDRQRDIGRTDVRASWKILYLSSFCMLLLSISLSWIGERIFPF